MGNAQVINNGFYDTLGDAWYNGQNVAMSILRKEAEFKSPWVAAHIERALGAGPLRILDAGCGGGFLSNYLARKGHQVLGLDASYTSVHVAGRRESRARYVQGDAYRIPLGDQSVSVVCAMDMLEHLERPAEFIAEAGRVLKPGGLFLFQTYNRTPISYVLFVWAVNRTPGAAPNTHVYRLFIKPDELREYGSRAGLAIRDLTGFKLAANAAALKTLIGRFDGIDEFQYELTPSLSAGFMGCAQKTA